MDAFSKGWFTELSPLWPGQALSLQVEEVLHREKSAYQDILVFRSKTYGRVLVLDGVIQCTERDEFAYQELITHLPLFSHPNPRKVLIVGGGDGGVVREVSKHPSVEEIHLCDIDERVIEISKEYLPFMSVGFSDPRLHCHIQDGAKFLLDHAGEFDVIITDSSDPIGPASSLFECAYFKRLHSSLRPGGIICSQGECQWLHLSLIKETLDTCRSLFPVTNYGYTTIPTYPSGQIGFILASTNKETVFEAPLRQADEEMHLKYYSPSIHKAAFVLPQFAKNALMNA